MASEEESTGSSGVYLDESLAEEVSGEDSAVYEADLEGHEATGAVEVEGY